MNITDLISGSVGNAAANSISEKLNIDAKKTKWLIAAAVPLMIAAINYNAKNKKQDAQINKALDEHANKGLLGNIAGSLMGGDTNEGSKILGHVFGDNTNMVTQGLAQQSGLSDNQVSGALGMLAPVVMGFLGSEKKSRQSSGGVADLLGSLMGGGQQSAKGAILGSLLSGGSKGSSGGGGMLGNVIGGMMGGNKPKQQQSPAGGLGPLADLAGQFFGQKDQKQQGSALESLAGMFLK